MSNDLTETRAGFSLAPKNIDEAIKFAEMLSKSNLVPKEFTGNSGNILVAIQWGLELGLQPMQAMQNIAVINGRPSLWGDSVIALVKASPLCEYVTETVDDTGATCKVKRKGELEQVRYFTVEDATKAGLYGKQGVWQQYPKRMMQMRARSWALRDVFPDVLRGMPIAEELQDMATERDITSQSTTIKPEKQFYSDDAFNSKLEAWAKLIKDGKKTPDTLTSFIESKGIFFTDGQKQVLNSIKPEPAQEQSKVQDAEFTETKTTSTDDFTAAYEQAESTGK